MAWFDGMCDVLGVLRKTREEVILGEMVCEMICAYPDYTDEDIFYAVCEKFEKLYR